MEGRLLPCSRSKLFVGKTIIMKRLPSFLHSTTSPLNENREDEVPTNISLPTC
jgi:hypothetical protein